MGKILIPERVYELLENHASHYGIDVNTFASLCLQHGLENKELLEKAIQESRTPKLSLSDMKKGKIILFCKICKTQRIFDSEKRHRAYGTKGKKNSKRKRTCTTCGNAIMF